MSRRSQSLLNTQELQMIVTSQLETLETDNASRWRNFSTVRNKFNELYGKCKDVCLLK